MPENNNPMSIAEATDHYFETVYLTPEAGQLMDKYAHEQGDCVRDHFKGICPGNDLCPICLNDRLVKESCCQAITKDGNQCKNPAKTNGYCHIAAHKAQFLKSDPGAITPVTTNKEKAMPTTLPMLIEVPDTTELFHYLFTSGGENPIFRVLTNNPKASHATAVRNSRMGNKVAPIEGSSASVLSVDTGSWGYPLLINRAIKMGINFTAVSYDIAVIKEMDGAELDGMIERANFAWATSSNAIFVKFEGYEGFDLSALGLKVDNHKKLSKRLTEILRCTGSCFYGNVTRREFVTPDGHEDIYHDGNNAISESFARKLGFKGTRGNIRVLTPEGLIKGDCVVVKGLDVDLVFHTENLKSELSTTDWTMTTIMDHAPLHDLRHDDQTRANFSFFISPETVLADYIHMGRDWISSVNEAGELYDYLAKSSTAFDDPIAVDMEMIQLSHRLEDQAQSLKEVGIAPASFSNITFTRTGAMKNKLNAHRIYKDGIGSTKTFKRMFIPATNAFVGSVSTYEFYTELCGLEFPDQDGTVTFWDDRFGLVMPGSRFSETYDLHGGWDSDDTSSVYAIKVFCSDDEKYDRLLDAGVIDPTLMVGRTAEDAISVGLFIRRPNGPGEYSIENVADGMPWRFYDEERVQTFDLADAPEAQSTVFSKVDMGTIPTSVTYDVPFDREFARDMILAQVSNPGVGGFANVIMAIASTFGPDNMPGEMLAAMEDIIDSVQQTADILAFAAITEETERLWTWFYNKVITDRVKVDAGLLDTRVPKVLGAGEGAINVVEDIIAAGLAYDGPQNKLFKKYDSGINQIDKVGKKAANDARLLTPLARLILRTPVGTASLKLWADDFLANINPLLRKVTDEFKVGTKASIIERRNSQLQSRIATEKFMDKWVDTIKSNDRYDTDAQVLTLYKVILLSGDVDRIFVQPSSVGHDSMLGLFVQACENKGLLLDLQLDALTLD